MKGICERDFESKFLSKFPDCSSCEEFVLKYKNDVDCNKCDTRYVLNNVKRIECKHGVAESITKGTPFYRSSTPLHKWFYAIYLLQNKPALTTEELKDKLNVTYKTAWRIKDKIKQCDVLITQIEKELENDMR